MIREIFEGKLLFVICFHALTFQKMPSSDYVR